MSDELGSLAEPVSPPAGGGPPTLWTVGHSTRPPAEMVALLHRYRVQMVVDVRRVPRSKKNPQTDREVLAAAFAPAGIGYLWMGEKLGGWRDEGFREYMKTEAFRRALAELSWVAERRRTAIMCAEIIFTRCHRRHVAEALRRQGWRVLHVVDADHLYVHDPPRRARRPTPPR